MKFSQAKVKFDSTYENESILKKSLCTVDGRYIVGIPIRDSCGQPNDEYYKWQFIYCMIHSEKIPSAEYIGADIYFSKGSIRTASAIIDAVVFSDTSWRDYYRQCRSNPKDADSLINLRKLAVGMIEFKRNGNTIETAFSSKIKVAMAQSDAPFVLGYYYDAGRLYLFSKIGNCITRFDNNLNHPASSRIREQYQLEITDPYYIIPTLDEITKFAGTHNLEDHSAMRFKDLVVVDTMQSGHMNHALNAIMKVFDSVGLSNEDGYMILIQLLAMKIYDEKMRRQYGDYMSFYIDEDEYSQNTLSNDSVQTFIARMKTLYNEAEACYINVLRNCKIEWTREEHIKASKEIVKRFQDYSFVCSGSSDLYQLIFYNFAANFQKDEKAQFLTPLPIVDFIVKIVNPKAGETICDPCCGCADFLSQSYINAGKAIGDGKLYGFDNDYNMTVLAQLNMLLNGDGNAVIRYIPDYGSITHKYTMDNRIVELNSCMHQNGAWDNWDDDTQLMKYDVILTNPPFGKNRSLNLSAHNDREAASLYELYHKYASTKPKAGLDKGVVFLENTVRQLKTGGRFGIVLSNSIMSNNTWAFVRKWVMKQVRIVALFDLPENVFAETGVNTGILIGYKPELKKLNELIENDYSVFTRVIQHVGYTKKTSKRMVKFENDYVLDPVTFETVMNEEGKPVSNEDFTETLQDFKAWCTEQETELKTLFLE